MKKPRYKLIKPWKRKDKRLIRRWWQTRSRLHRFWLILLALIILWVGGMYSIASWYIWQNRNKPVEYGTTFVPRYAEYFGLEPRETLDAILNDLNIQHIRLVSYWDDIQSQASNRFDFSGLDWQFEMAKTAGAKVSLAIGLRQPRWPECHVPYWAETMPKSDWYRNLNEFITETVNRYKDHPALESYQLENEFFLKAFGECTDFNRERLVSEYELVKSLDSDTTLIINRSNNALGLPVRAPQPDLFGISVYKRVWDRTITKRYFEYPFPAWFYGFLAGAGKIVTGKDMIIHELQAEPWIPDGFHLNTAPISEQDKSLSPERLKHRLEYGKATGMKRIDLWGAEWWYSRKVQGDPTLWNIVKNEVHTANQKLQH